MRLIEAEFRNFCQHRELKVEFAPNLNAILGPNGSGKTNLLNGIYFALTGDMRGYGVNADNICQLAGEKDPSFVRLNFEHGGVKAEVKRSLRPNGSELQIQGEKDNYVKTSEVNKKLEGIIGLPRRILSDFIFIEQAKISAFLSMKPSDRAVALQRLFGTQHCERAWGAIGDHMKGVTVPVPRVDVEVVNKRIETNRKTLTTLRSKLESCPITDSWELRSDPDFWLKEAFIKSASLSRENDKLVEQLHSAKYKLKTAAEAKTRLDQEFEALISERECIDSQAMLQAVNGWNMYHSMEKARAQVERDMQDLQEEAAQAEKPEHPPEDLLEGDALVAYFGKTKTLEVELHNLRGFMDAFDSDETSLICPTCENEVKADDIEQKMLRLRELELEIKERKALMNRSKAWSEAVARYKLWAMDYKKRSLKVAERLDDLSDFMEPPFVPEEEATKQLQRADVLDNQIKGLATRVRFAQSDADTARARVEMLESNIADKQEQITNLELPAGEPKRLLEAAERRLEVKEKAYRERIRLNAEVTSLEQQISSDEAAAMDASRVLVRAGRYRDWLDVLDSSRSVLHKEALPKLISQRYLQALEDEINKILSELSAPFRVRTGEDLGFIAEFADGGIHRAERLSTGQKSILSLAMRIVVNATFAGDTGLLSLDEPTEGLDSDNLQGLEVALKRLQTLSKDRGLQCLLVTHEDALEPLFDQVITLSAPV